MNILIVEDENTVAARLERLTREILGDTIDRLKQVHSLDDADDYLSDNIVDLLFLDLNLGGRDGFDLLKKAVAGSFHTIIVSAYAEKAIEAFEYGVLDFVAKPFTRQRLEKALDRFNTPYRQQETKFLAVKRLGIIESVDLAEVCFFKGANNYSELFVRSGEELLHDKSLNRLEQLLPAHFLRVHKSYIVNERMITGMRQAGNSTELILDSGQSVPVSRTKVAEFKKRFI